MTVEELKQQVLDADREYQFALAAGEPARLTRALQNNRRTMAAYNAAKRRQFKSTFVSKYATK